jgi:hypothetical protein
MAKGRRAQRAIKDRRQFLTGAMIATALSIFNSTLGIVDRLLSWRSAPTPSVLTPAPVTIALTVPTALVVGEAVMPIGTVTVTTTGTVVTPGTRQLALGLEAANQPA